MEDVNGALKIWKKHLSTRVERTRNEYFRTFNMFVEWAKKTPEQLRIMKYEESQKQEPWLRTEVENLVRQYLGYLNEKGYSGSYIHVVLSSIKSFFSAQNMPLRLNSNDRPRVASEHASAVPTHKDMKKIVDAADSLRNRALVLFLKDTGLRVSDVAKLKWKDLKPREQGFCGFKIVTEKKKVVARGFFGLETTEALELYRKQRLGGTRHVKPEKNIEDHFVFVPLPVSGHFDGGRHGMDPAVVGARVGDCIKLAGFRGKYTPHGLRKFWEQNVRADREAYLKQLNGRKLSAVERAYYWRTEEQLCELYKENYDNLRIFSTTIKEADIDRIVEKRLKERLEAVTLEKTTALENLLKRVEELEKKLAEKS